MVDIIFAVNFLITFRVDVILDDIISTFVVFITFGMPFITVMVVFYI